MSFDSTKTLNLIIPDPNARGLGFKPRRVCFLLEAKKEWGLSPKTKFRVLHTAQLEVTSYSTNRNKVVLLRPKQRLSLTMRDSRCLTCNQHLKSSFVYCSLVCKLSNLTASPSGQRLYVNSSNNLERSLLVSGSECVVSAESSVEENSTVATACDETVYECVDYVKGVHPPDQKMSATISRKLHGRKCVPQRSPLF
nr:hypothetical protein [Tanacetum cinerariifolium]